MWGGGKELSRACVCVRAKQKILSKFVVLLVAGGALCAFNAFLSACLCLGISDVRRGITHIQTQILGHELLAHLRTYYKPRPLMYLL